MSLHVALLETRNPATAGAIARRCAEADASLHLIGPLEFAADDPEFRSAGPANWEVLDWWLHPGWRDFRDAITRERCIYFAVDADRPATEAPIRANSVLILGDVTGGLPDRIRLKYPQRIFALPAQPRRKVIDVAQSVGDLLTLATKRLAEKSGVIAPPPAAPIRYGRGRGR